MESLQSVRYLLRGPDLDNTVSGVRGPTGRYTAVQLQLSDHQPGPSLQPARWNEPFRYEVTRKSSCWLSNMNDYFIALFSFDSQAASYPILETPAEIL